jgi:spermidine/putrescine transport system permease protein
MPEIVLAIALFIFFMHCKISLGYTTLIISHVSLVLGYIIPLISMKWEEINKKYFTIAYNLGATKESVWYSIIIPILKPTLLGLFFFSFIISFNDYIFFYFCSATDTKIITNPLLGIVKNGLNQEARALYGIMLTLSTFFIITYYLYGYYHEVKK